MNNINNNRLSREQLGFCINYAEEALRNIQLIHAACILKDDNRFEDDISETEWTINHLIQGLNIINNKTI